MSTSFSDVLDGFDALEKSTRRVSALIHACIEYREQEECACEHKHTSTLLYLADELALCTLEHVQSLSRAVLPSTPLPATPPKEG